MENKLFKKISKTGGITIPAQVRHQMNIPKGAAVENRSNGRQWPSHQKAYPYMHVLWNC